MPVQQPDRNAAIVRAYLAGEPVPALVAEHGLGAKRIYQILAKAKATRHDNPYKGPRAKFLLRFHPEQADALDRLQDLTGETQSEAVAIAVQERLARLEARAAKPSCS